MNEPNEVIFTRATLDSAMATNCSYYHRMSVQERHKLETRILLDALDPIMDGVKRVMDFGLGVGRVTKAILERYPDVNVIGVDSSHSMLEHAAGYIPKRFFEEKKVDCIPIDHLPSIPDESIDLILGIYVLQHVDQDLLPKILDQWERVSKKEGKIYVLNGYRRAVPKEKRFGLYKVLRKAFRSFEYHCDHKQIQRLSIKLDNKCLLFDDGVDIQDELSGRYAPVKDIPLDGHPHIERLMRNHFSRVYTRRNRNSVCYPNHG